MDELDADGSIGYFDGPDHPVGHLRRVLKQHSSYQLPAPVVGAAVANVSA